MVDQLFLTVPWGCLRFVIVVFPDHTNLQFYADKSILRALIWLVWLMHVLYSQNIGYNDTPSLPVLNGLPSWVVRSAS